MKRAILIHAWEETPDGQWLPWVGKTLQAKGWHVDIPEMPNTKKPKLIEWMSTLESLSPDENTLLVGHSLSNALILNYLEKPETKVLGAIMVAAWDWLMEDVKEFHETFFEAGFDYDAIRAKSVPLVVVNSTTDPWIDLDRSRTMARKLGATFISIKNAGHFMERDGYTQFPKLIDIIEEHIL